MKIVAAFIAGFLTAMGIAQARGLNAKPWESQ